MENNFICAGIMNDVQSDQSNHSFACTMFDPNDS